MAMSAEGPRAVSVVLADDHPTMRDGIRSALGSEAYVVVAEAADLGGTLAATAGEQPDVLILDLNLGGQPALRAIPALLGSSPSTRVLVLTQDASPGFATEALRAGASGYLLKSSPSHQLLAALGAVVGGGRWVDPALGAGVLRGDGPAALSRRERDIVVRIARGLTNADIAADMALSLRTVEAQRARIRSALGLSSRAELTQWARDQGLLG